MKRILFSIILISIIAFSTDRLLSEFNIFGGKESTTQTNMIPEEMQRVPLNDPRNMTYLIEGDTLILKDGKATATSSIDDAIVSSVMLFGNPTYGDLDADGDTDAAVLLVSQSGGTGTF